MTAAELCIELIRNHPLEAEIDIEVWTSDGKEVFRMPLLRVGDDMCDHRLQFQATLYTGKDGQGG